METYHQFILCRQRFSTPGWQEDYAAARFLPRFPRSGHFLKFEGKEELLQQNMKQGFAFAEHSCKHLCFVLLRLSFTAGSITSRIGECCP